MHCRIVVALGLACLAGSPAVRAQQNQQQPDLNAFMGALGSMMQGNTNAAAAPAIVDFRALKALLPAELPALKRTGASGEKSGAMGMTMAFATGRYEGENGALINIKLTDMGGTGLAAMMHAGWTMAEVDRETETGYERTTTIQGNKAMEKFDTASKSGSVQIMVGGRFMVEVEGDEVTPEALQQAVGQVDLEKLAALKPATP